MRRLTAEQLRVGVPTWYTVPQPLGHGRIVVCDELRPDGRIWSQGIVADHMQMYLNRNPDALSYFLYMCIHCMLRGQHAKTGV